MARRVSNPPNPWESTHVEWLGEPPLARLEVYEEEARTVLSRNESPDIPFRYSVNPYRGCQHACAYCYARPSHQYLGFGAGTDFEKRIVVKTNAAECLARELAKRSWRGEPITFSGNTDCYQPLEASYALTQACLEVCRQRRNPVAVITKSSLVLRDLDLLTSLARAADVRVFVSVPFADASDCRALEPGAPVPAKRFETLRALAAAGIRTGVAVAPLIPGLNEAQVPEILERAAAAGAKSAFLVLLRLAAEVEPVFRERLETSLPARARHVFSALDDVRRGQARPWNFGTRMHGRGPRWESVKRLFELHARRLGLATREGEDTLRPMTPEVERPAHGQGLLFGGDA